MRSGLLAFCLVPAVVLAALPQAAAQASEAPPEWVVAQLQVALPGFSHAQVAGTLSVHKAVVQGSTYTAQSLRDTYAQAARFGGGDAFAAQLDAFVAGGAQQALAAMFPGANFTIRTATVNMSSLAAPRGADAYHPPVTFAFAADASDTLGLLGASAADEAKLRALLDLGARVTYPLAFGVRPGWNTTLTLQLPEGMAFERAEGGTVSADGGTATWRVANWLSPGMRLSSGTLVVHGRAAPASDAASDAHLDVAVDMRDVAGLTIPGALQGDFGRLQVVFDATLTMRSVRLEDVPSLQAIVSANLPDGVTLDRVSADGLRIAVRDGLVPADALDRLQQELGAVASARAAAFGADLGDLQASLGSNALAPNLISSPPDGEPPLVFAVHAAFQLPLGTARTQALSVAAAIGPNLIERDLSFGLPRVQGLATTYRIVLPDGIALTGVEAEGATYQQGTQQGRDVIVLTPQEDDAHATFHVAVTSGFALAKFWYVWMGVLVLGALGVVAMLALRRRRRGRRAAPRSAPAEPLSAGPAPAASPLPQPGPGTDATRSEP